MKINEHFYLDGDKIKNNCGYGCCMHCKYLLDSQEGNHKWFACSESCLVNENMIGKSCSNCEYTQYGKKL